MGSMVEKSVRQAIDALATRDTALAHDVIEEDLAIDKLALHIEQTCLDMLALQQPLARDLRLVAAAISIATDLERMGDEAANISEVVLRIASRPLIKPLVDIPRMAEAAQRMISECLNAFVDRDADRARAVCISDDDVDAIYAMLFDELMEIIVSAKEEWIGGQAAHLLFVARFLERIGDHATNVAERVIYMVTGVRETY